jgi:hypothetical protein
MKFRKIALALFLSILSFIGYSQINVGTNFSIRANAPIDTRLIVADLTARDNIAWRYEGLLVYVISNQTNYQLRGGTTNADWVSLSTTAYAAGTGLTLSGNSFSHDPHTGDVIGSTSLTIVALQGRTIDTTIPSSGDVLSWNGSAWAPQPAFANYATGTGITLSGNTFSADNTSPIWNANQIMGSPFSTTAPTGTNQVIKWNGTEWAPANDSSSAYAAGSGIILSGYTFSADNTSPIWNAGQIMGFNINSTAPFPTQVLKWNGTDWSPANDSNNVYEAGTGITLAGNTFSADNTSPIWNANQIMGTSISTTGPTGNQILKWNGTEWTPADEQMYDAGTGIILLGNTFTADYNAPLWNASMIWGTSISSLAAAPNPNEILKFNGTDWVPAADATGVYDAGAGLLLSGNTFSANYSASIWNANKLQGLAISATAPTPTEVLKWNGTDWAPAADNNTTYSANGPGLSLSGTTFSANYSASIWNANKLQGQDISATGPSNGQILKWNGTIWTPTNENAYAAGTGLSLSGTTFIAQNNTAMWNASQLQGSTISASVPSNNQILKYTGGTWTPTNETSYDAGTGISLSGSSFSHIAHTGDATGATSLTVTGIQGRSVATTIPTTGNILKWNGSLWAMGSTMDTFNANKPVTRSGWTGVSNVNMGTNTNIADFLNAVFFPFVSASISINAGTLFEVGTVNTITLSGTTTANSETIFSNGRIDRIYPSTLTVYTFGAATSYSTTQTFSPNQSVTSTLELRFVAYQGVGNNGTPATINSATRFSRSVYPYLHGTSTINFTSGGTSTYLGLTKVVEAQANKTKLFNGTGYMYFCYPASYGTLTSILDQNGFQQLTNFTIFSQNVNSSGLVNNWSEPYYIYRSNSISTPTNYNFQFFY